MNEVPIDINKIKGVVDTLVRGKVVDKILTTMDHGFGDVTVKIVVQNKTIKVIQVMDTQTVKFE